MTLETPAPTPIKILLVDDHRVVRTTTSMAGQRAVVSPQRP